MMNKRGLIPMILLTAVATRATADPTPPLGSPVEQRKQIIEAAYANLARFIATGGSTFGFKIDRLRTIGPQRFADTEWLDLMTMPGGDMIDVMREVRRADGAVEALVYRATWKLDGENYLDGDEGRRLHGMSVADVQSAVADENPDLSRVVAITSYRVKVVLADHSRTYRAAVFWLQPEAGRDAKLLFMDHITQGLERAVHDQWIRPRARRLATPKPAAACMQRAYGRVFSQNQWDEAGHTPRLPSGYNGAHIAIAQARFDCGCQEDCSAFCQSTFLSASCGDAGTTVDGCHKMASDIGIDLVSTDDGRQAGPRCAAGLGCVKRSCTFCSCNVGVSVVMNGINASFVTSGSPDWTGNLPFSHTCDACIPLQDPPPDGEPPPIFDQDPGSGGTGGGGQSGSCCAWLTTCRSINGVYTCGITNTCAIWGC
jgi:hypothetical protein